MLIFSHLKKIKIGPEMSVKSILEAKLAEFSPDFLSVENESHQHNVPENSETHFKVTIVSAEFEGLRPVQRHQKVYAVLAEELQSGVHALALHTFTASEWQDYGVSPDSPPCLGGGDRSE